MLEDTKDVSAEEKEPEVEPKPKSKSEPEPKATDKKYNWRDEPEFKKRMTEYNEMKRKLEEVKALEDERAKALEIEKLKKVNDIEALIKRTDEEKRQLQAAFEAQKRELKLEALLGSITDELTRAGAMARCPADVEVEDYVAELKSTRPDLWKTLPLQNGKTPSSARSESTDTTNWDKVYTDMNSTNWAVSSNAFDQVGRYAKKYGKYPPGYKG
jgi:alanyl-tRNA synthetase